MSRKRKNKKGLFSKVIITIITLFLAAVVVSGAYLYIGLSNLSKNNQLKGHSDYKNGLGNNKNSINILALGVDIGTPGSENKNDPKRTDTMILIHYDKINDAVSMVSIPRDTLIKVNGKNTKINAANAIGGVPYAVNAVEELLDVNINYYGKVNYEGFREIVDAIGGVDMDIEYNMNYDDPGQDLHIHFKKGEKVHLDGKKAEEFFRWRKNNDGTGLAGGDLGRIKNQQVLINKVIEKLKSPKIIPRIPRIFMVLPNYVETNMSGYEMMKYGLKFITSDDVSMYSLQGDTDYIGGISYFIYRKNDNKELLARLNNVSSKNSAGIDKDKIKIKILNGNGKNGLAAKYKEYLESLGYKNISTGNTEYTETTKIEISDNFNKKQRKYINKEFKIENIVSGSNNEDYDVLVILGKDYDG